MSEKVYYFLRLPEDFFSDKVMKRLRALPGGDAYTIIALKILLLGLRTENVIRYDGLCPSIAGEIAVAIDEQAEAVQVVLSYLELAGWIEIWSDSSVYSAKGAELVTSLTDRGYRKQKQKQRERLEASSKAELCSDPVPQEFRDSSVETSSEEMKDQICVSKCDKAELCSDPVPQEFRPSSADEKEKVGKEKTSLSKKEPSLERGKERKVAPSRFFPPSPQKVQAYLDQRGIRSFTGEDFCDAYSRKGWKLGGDLMTDWRAGVRTWERRDRERGIDPQVDKMKQAGVWTPSKVAPHIQRDVTGQFNGLVAKECE